MQDEGPIDVRWMKRKEQTKELRDMAAKVQYLEQQLQILERQAEPAN